MGKKSPVDWSQNRGYQQFVVEKARRKMREFGAEFLDMFVEQPKTPAQMSARAYFLDLKEELERSALLEAATMEALLGTG